MKKNYLEPQMELINLETAGFLAASLGDIETGGGGEVTPSDPVVDPKDPGWGGDY